MKTNIWARPRFNGNVTQVVDLAAIDPNDPAAAAGASYEYAPFGDRVNSDPNATELDQPFRFGTKYYDEETGLYYFGHRYYNPTHGRWLNRDRIGELGGVNLYAYAANEPIDRHDPLGDEWILCPWNPYCFWENMPVPPAGCPGEGGNDGGGGGGPPDSQPASQPTTQPETQPCTRPRENEEERECLEELNSAYEFAERYQEWCADAVEPRCQASCSACSGDDLQNCLAHCRVAREYSCKAEAWQWKKWAYQECQRCSWDCTRPGPPPPSPQGPVPPMPPCGETVEPLRPPYRPYPGKDIVIV